MSIFNIFRKKEESNPAMSIALPVVEPQGAVEEQIGNAVSAADKTNPAVQGSNSPLTVSYATGWPIDVIYGYLHKNYEQKGYEDAMVKSDLAFRDMNMNIIKNKILMVFREVNLNYEALRHDVETRLETCNAAGLLSTITELEKTLTIINSHKEELKQLESDFINNANEASIPLQSYECGFLRCLATLAMGGTTKANNVSFTTPMMNKMAVG